MAKALFIWFSVFCSLSAQVSLIEYHASLDIRKPKSQAGKNTLYFDPTSSLYIHDDYPTKNDYVEKGMVIVFIKGDSEGLPIYKDLSNDTMIWKEDYASPKATFIWSSSIPDFDWKLRDSTKTIGGYTCSRARCMYGGRIYEAWYTPQIPASFGPYKFGGLPGMILEIYSTDGKIRYDFVAYSSQGEMRPLIPPTDGIVMDSTKYKKFMIKSLEISESTGATDNDPPSDWEIELKKHTNYARIKKERGY